MNKSQTSASDDTGSTATWHAVMQAEDLRPYREALKAADAVLSEVAQSRPRSKRQSLSVTTPESHAKAVETAARMRIGLVYGEGEVDTAIRNALANIVRVAEYTGIDFEGCLAHALWHYASDVIDDGSSMPIPEDVVNQAEDLADEVRAMGGRASPGQVRDLGQRLVRGGILELTHGEAELLTDVRDALERRVDSSAHPAWEARGGI